MRNKPKGNVQRGNFYAPIGTASTIPKERLDLQVIPKGNNTWEVRNALDFDEPYLTVTVHNARAHEIQGDYLVSVFNSIIANFDAENAEERDNS